MEGTACPKRSSEHALGGSVSLLLLRTSSVFIIRHAAQPME